ncbi:MAG: disulfide bond formation protein B [Sulfuricaulis sp.]|nr:disulfide bond formation protein B [Sulfuricaulis sp.]
MLINKSPRVIFFSGFLVCAGLMVAALYFQYVMHLEPCPLCIFQRLLVIGAGLILLAGALQNPGVLGQRLYGGMIALDASLGAAVAGRHLWIQSLPFDQLPGCSYDFDTMLEKFPWQKTLKLVFEGTGECAKVDWTFLGLSMPGWTLIFFTGLVGLGMMLVFSPVGKPR